MPTRSSDHDLASDASRALCDALTEALATRDSRVTRKDDRVGSCPLVLGGGRNVAYVIHARAEGSIGVQCVDDPDVLGAAVRRTGLAWIPRSTPQPGFGAGTVKVTDAESARRLADVLVELARDDTVPRQPRVWRIYVREGDRGRDYADQALKGRYVALGGTDAGPVDEAPSKSVFLAAFRQAYGARSVKRAREVWRLHEESGPRDWVLMPSREARRVHVGQITTDGYWFQKKNDGCRFGHRWRVEWLGHAGYDDARDVCGKAVLGPGALVAIRVPYAAIAELLARATGTPVERPSEPLRVVPTEGTSLAARDASDIEAVYRGGVVTVCRLHNEMTNRIRELCESRFVARQGSSGECLFDVLIERYDEGARDLLIEVKSTLDRGSLRLAVGQLLDYRRGVARPSETDLAVLLPSPPEPDAVAFLRDVGVRVLWFSDANLSAIAGEWALSPA